MYQDCKGIKDDLENARLGKVDRERGFGPHREETSPQLPKSKDGILCWTAPGTPTPSMRIDTIVNSVTSTSANGAG